MVVPMMMMVVAWTSLREGQVTFFSSARTSTRNVRRSFHFRGTNVTASWTKLGLPAALFSPPPSLLFSTFFFASSVFVISATAICSPNPGLELDWQARRDSNPQPPVLETGAPPIELLACRCYFVSLCDVCFRQCGQYLLSSSRSVV